LDAAVTERITKGMIFEAARTAPPEGFPKLSDIPAGRYVDAEFLSLEQNGLWKRSWLYAGKTSSLSPAAGSLQKTQDHRS
jgi:hypothetical protein